MPGLTYPVAKHRHARAAPGLPSIILEVRPPGCPVVVIIVVVLVVEVHEIIVEVIVEIIILIIEIIILIVVVVIIIVFVVQDVQIVVIVILSSGWSRPQIASAMRSVMVCSTRAEVAKLSRARKVASGIR